MGGLLSLDRIANTALMLNPSTAPFAMAKQFFSAVGQQFIQRLGEQMGMKQSQIDMAQSRFAVTHGDNKGARSNLREAFSEMAKEARASTTEEADAEREMNETLNKMATSLAEGQDQKASKSGGKGGQSWLMALAEALGKKLDKMASEMSTMADQITDKTPSLTAKFGAKSQEFGILMNAATNAIKTIGEAEANSARKG